MHEGAAMKSNPFFRTTFLASALTLAVGSSLAHAQAPGADPAPAPAPSAAEPAPSASAGSFVPVAPPPAEVPAPVSTRPLPTVAITISPLHMVVPMLELTGELRVGRKLGIAAIGGVGSIRDEVTDRQIRVFEGGASVRYYVLGTFRHGMQLGGELLYVKANTADTMVEVRAKGLGISPFIGYKYTHRIGFTVDTQLGISFMTAQGESANATAEKSKVGALLNLNVGWSI